MFLKFKNYLKEKYPHIGVIKRTVLAAEAYKYYSEQKMNVIILCYHRVGNNEPDPYLVNVNIKNFEQQMKYIHDNYKILRLQDRLKNDSRAVVLTFDDGYYDNYCNALPILKQYSIPATFFIPTDNIGFEKELWDQDLLRILYYRTIDSSLCIENEIVEINQINLNKNINQLHSIMLKLNPIARIKIIKLLEAKLKPSIACRKMSRLMNEKEIFDLSANELMDVGVHTCTHTALANLDYNEQLKEISQAKEKLEKITGKYIDTIAYPFGRKGYHYNEYTLNIVKKLNFSRGVTTNNSQIRANTSMLELPRIHVGDWDRNKFRKMLDLYWRLG